MKTDRALPLEGIRGIDSATFIAAPFCAFLLGDFGAEVIRLLEEAEVPAGLVNSVQDLLGDPQIQARQNVVEIDDPNAGKLKIPGVLPKLSLTPGVIQSPAPPIPGQDNESIYCGLLGLSIDELEGLRRRKVI